MMLVISKAYHVMSASAHTGRPAFYIILICFTPIILKIFITAGRKHFAFDIIFLIADTLVMGGARA